MKVYDNDFIIDKKYATVLRQKANIFKLETKTRKQLFYVLVTTDGLHKNEHSIGLIDNVITMKKLFVPCEL